MKRKPVIPREQVNRDVDEAWYLSEATESAALGFIDALEQAYTHIGRHPGTGSPRHAHELNLPGLRAWPLTRYPHVVFCVDRPEHIDPERHHRMADPSGRPIRPIPHRAPGRYRVCMAHDHDTGYKLLFSAPEMVRDLLRGYVPQQWVESADFASLRRVNASYVSENLRRRDGDMVWKIRLGEQWLYVYLLLEFQSVPDRWMALRMQVYVGLLYQDLVARRELGADGKLPPVLPIVLYNGAVPWRWADSLEALLSGSPPGLLPYRAQARYLLVDERRLAASAGPLRNLAGALFRLEAASELGEFQAVTKQLVEWLSGEEHRRLRRAFALWPGRVLAEPSIAAPFAPS